MLCTRCQQREVRPVGRSPEERAAFEKQFEAQLGVPWPFPYDLCKECFGEWIKGPEGKARLEPLQRAVEGRWREHMEKFKNNLRATALKVLDVADAIAGRL